MRKRYIVKNVKSFGLSDKKFGLCPTPFSVDFYKYPYIYMKKMSHSTVYLRNIGFVYF